MRQIARSQGILPLVKEIHIFEGHRTSQTYASGDRHDQDMTRIEEQSSIEIPQLIEAGAVYLMPLLEKVSINLSSHQRKIIYESIDDWTSEAGTSVDSGGKPFSIELYLEVLNGMDIEFTDSGVPNIPTIVGSDASLGPKILEWQQDARFSELVAKKRLEWNDRESNRKLVD